jgi:DNA-binding MarR family transcriptional regulator
LDPNAPVIPSPAADELVAALEELARAQREAAGRAARDLAWPRAELGVVRMLHRCGPTQLGDVAARLRVDVSVASRHVSALVDAGLVRRTVDEDDRRVRTLELTAEGRALADESRKHFAQYVSAVLTDWTSDDVGRATQQIHRIAAALTTAPPKQPVPDTGVRTTQSATTQEDATLG